MQIPTYIINLKNRQDRLISVLEQFKNKKEFDVNVIEACENSKGNVGLWQSIIKIINLAIEFENDVILIVEDDHIFTEKYNKKKLFRNIFDAHAQGADLLLGGIGGGFKYIVPIADQRFWIDHFWCTQFMIIYKKFYHPILNVNFSSNDAADNVISNLTINKMVIHPFISVQKDFGYSDIPNLFNNEKSIEMYFNEADQELNKYQKKIKIFKSLK
jgi:hypothetical protein